MITNWVITIGNLVDSNLDLSNINLLGFELPLSSLILLILSVLLFIVGYLIVKRFNNNF